MIFVLTMLFTFVYDRKNENHWSLLVICYSEYKHPLSMRCSYLTVIYENFNYCFDSRSPRGVNYSYLKAVQ